MSHECGNCKANPVDIARNTQGTPTAKLIAILAAHGITSAAEIAEIVGISDRAVRKARNSGSGTEVPPGTTGPELQDRPGTQVPKTELQDRNSGSAPSRAHATKELPSEVSLPRRLEQQQQMPPIERIHSAAMAAAGEALNPVSIGLNMVSDIIGWINQGADLDLDIVPTIAAVSIGKRHSINSWRFYASAVSSATNARKRGLPPPIEASSTVVRFRPTDTSGRPIRTTSEVLAMIAAEDAAHAAV